MNPEMFESIFRKTLETAQPFQATTYRAVQDKYRQTPLSAVGSIRVGGRYNPKGVFEALYLAESPEVALGEVGFSRSSGGKFETQPLAPYLLLSVQVQLQQVIRLEDWLADLEINLENLLAPWRHLQNEGKLPLTQAIGTAALNVGLEGLIVPSRLRGDAHNLVVFPSNLQTDSSIEVFDLEGGISATLRKMT
jgi:RES domain-containing protein